MTGLLKKSKIILKSYSVIIIIFTIFICALLYFFENNKNEKIKEYTENLKSQYNFQYNTVYENFRQISQNTFYGIINKSIIFNNVKSAYKKDKQTQDFYRKKLYDTFIADYSRLVGYNFKQLHFHFPDNTSFLRMHKPEKYGDDLSKARYSVVKANKELKPVEGFEIGKIIHGYRFVFPLHDENLFHLGSVEASVSSNYFERNFEKNFKVDAHFLVNKEMAEKKMFPNELKKDIAESDENDKYFIIKEGEEETYHFTNKNFYSKNEKKLIQNKMAKSENFLLIKKVNSDYYNICFLPIKNIEGIKNSAYLILYSKADFIQQIYFNYYKVIFILFLMIVIFILFLNKKYNIDEQNRKKQIILSQQSKMAAMGEMIGNIAHQWRQPLSIISTATTGMKVQKEVGVLTDEMLYDNLDKIYEYTQYLSRTIDDFRNYFNQNKQKQPFKIGNIIDQSLSIFGSTFKNKNISVIKNIEDITIVSFPNELQQVIINLLKNAKDIIEKNGLIIITVTKKNNIITINIKDSGGGIAKNILPKIFEPYFTTKHKSIGTGLGLFMSFEIVNKSLNGTLEVKNEEFTYNFINYNGASFTITLNSDKL